MQSYSEIVDTINSLRHDIRAEVVAAEIIEKGVPPVDIFIIPDGSFTRSYSWDVSYAEVITLENGQKVIGIHVTRDGLYDCLPEALFHRQFDEPYISGHYMAKLSKHQKTEEKQARKFFLPFENELFYHRVQMEIKERKILQRFSENLFDEIYPQFWNLDRSLPKKLVSRLILVLHLAHKIPGNTELTANCLETILEEAVKIKVIRQRQPGRDFFPEIKNTAPLGSTRLGENFICGNYHANLEPVMEFEIGPLNNSTIEDYLENGSYTRFLNCFYNYFVPVEMDTVTTVKVNREQHQFALNDPQQNVILGFNSGI